MLACASFDVGAAPALFFLTFAAAFAGVVASTTFGFGGGAGSAVVLSFLCVVFGAFASMLGWTTFDFGGVGCVFGAPAAGAGVVACSMLGLFCFALLGSCSDASVDSALLASADLAVAAATVGLASLASAGLGLASSAAANKCPNVSLNSSLKRLTSL